MCESESKGMEVRGGKKNNNQGLILVSKLRLGSPLSAEFVLGVVLVQQFDVCEGEVAVLAFTFALPLAVHVYFGHHHHVAHLRRDGREERHERVQKHGSHCVHGEIDED